MRIVLVTGMSGAGKSTALRALEDLEYFCVDNLPLPLVHSLVALLGEKKHERVALLLDARQGEFLTGYPDLLRGLAKEGHQVEALFLDAGDEILFRRFSETRRRHPLAGDDLRLGIASERKLLAPVREASQAVVDSGNLNVHQLKGIIQERYGLATGTLSVTLLSFGYKNGLPAEADVVFDVRFLPNPYFVDGLSASNGLDEQVSRFVLDGADARDFVQRTLDFLRFSLPRFAREGKSYLTVAIGCTGGRHRSVAVVEDVAKRLGGDWQLTIRHRDLERRGIGS
jgi:RNase adapter protein RapZ